MRSLVVVFLALFAAACNQQSIDYATAEHATLVIEQNEVGSGHGAAGVIIGPGLILTAKHVVKGGMFGTEEPPLFGTDYAGNHYKLSVLWAAPEGEDLALLTTDETLLSASAPITCDEPKLHDTVLLVGHPGLLAKWVFAWGQIASDLPFSDPDFPLKHALVTGIFATHGDSGGPVFDALGRVFGVMSGGIPGSGTTFVSPVSTSCKAIQDTLAQRLLDTHAKA